MDASPFFAEFQPGRLHVDGVEIYYVVGGSGPPLLLVHGAPQSHVMWRSVAPALAESFTVVIPDLRGYGRSGKPDRADYSKRRMAADLTALMGHLGHHRFRAAGHDRGARVIRRLIKDHPGRVERAVILDIVPTVWIYSHLTQAAVVNMWNWAVLPARYPLPETILDPVALITMAGAMMGDDPAATEDYVLTNGNRESLHAMCEDYRAGAGIDQEHDHADAGHRIGIPLLVLWGARSGTTGQVFDIEAAWRAEAEDVRIKSLPCGHFMPEEAPEAVLAEMTAFLAPGRPTRRAPDG